MPEALLLVIVTFAGGNDDTVFIFLVYDTIHNIYPSAPPTEQVASQRLWLSRPFIRRVHHLFQQRIYAFECLLILPLPMQKVL